WDDRHGPGPLTPAEKAALEAISAGEAAPGHEGLAPGVRFDMPDWLLDAFGEVPQQTALALRARAPLDLRVNTLKTDREAAVAALAAEGVVAVPGPLSPTCLRVEAGARGVARTRTYADGLVEIQDAASQAAADFAGAEPGMTVVDLCAGGGGKMLALGAAMAGRGDLVAHDIDARRMADLPPRAARAGLEVCAVDAEGLQAWEGRADLIFADAPCSGSGAWRRNPDARWRLTPARLSALTATQDAIIDRALGLLAPGGHLVFATCSFLPLEGPLRIDAALARHPGLRLVDRGGDGGHFATLPDPERGDGFFAARLENSRTG
ncbi:MAG: RsmB/NOP family class I SAM-dependent RNA methyltransferase, partial [Pseudomonadota bacterium]